MITIQDIIREFGLEVFSGKEKLGREVRGAYASDLLSDVMGKASAGNIWITMQTHRNILAVASLKEISAVLIVNGGHPDDDTRATAEAEGIVMLGTRESSFITCGRLYKRMEKDAMV